MHRSSVIFSSIFCAGLLVIAWQEYYPRSTLLDVMGIHGPRASSGRRCDAAYSHKNFWTHPSRTVMCFNPGFSYRFAPNDFVRVDAVSRRVVFAVKVWVEPDSASWAKDVDSVSRALTAMDGAPYRCKFQPTLVPPSSWTYWKVRGYFVRVTAFGSTNEEVTPYQIQVEGERDVSDECLHPLRTQESANVCADATVRVPLPGHYEWCWTSPFGL
ncbi:MAG TPA: hypothetical protein VLJ83_09020 [Gemmatimonadaceae bacterium]|nr:hypothetical protein [Gemmatimonadaceae bacterium]